LNRGKVAGSIPLQSVNISKNTQLVKQRKTQKIDVCSNLLHFELGVVANYTSTMRTKKLLRWAFAIYAVVFGLMWAVPDNLHRLEFGWAFNAWLHDPTPQNEERLKREELKNDIVRAEINSIVALAAVSVVSGVYFAGAFVWRRIELSRRNGAMPTTPSNPA
jgi:hypothetical protein